MLGVGFAALLDGAVDPNVSPGLLLLDDGQNGDAAAGDGIYTNSGVTHGMIVARDDDTGPRIVRIAAEVEGADGRRHATAVDIGTLTLPKRPPARKQNPITTRPAPHRGAGPSPGTPETLHIS